MDAVGGKESEKATVDCFWLQRTQIKGFSQTVSLRLKHISRLHTKKK